MKRLFLPAVVTMLMTACHDNDGLSWTWIQDNSREHFMPVSLFDGNAPQLADSLGLQDGIPSSMSAFLVRAEGSTILFDTGLGGPDSRLLQTLESEGLSPADIGYIYLTHFHGDHIGGMMNGDETVFPNAEVYASKAEYDAWMSMPEDSRAQAEKTMKAYGDRLHLFNAGDILPGNVTTMDAAGHTPGHTVFQVGNLLIIGDLMHGAALQMADPEICAGYDMDKEAAVRARKHFLKYAGENGLTMLGMHLPGGSIRN